MIASSILVQLKLAARTFALVRFASFRSAEVRSAPTRLAPLKSAPERLAPTSFAPLKFALFRSASLRSAQERSALARSTPPKLASVKSTAWSSGRVSGYSSLHLFQFSVTPCLKRSSCCWFAIVIAPPAQKIRALPPEIAPRLVLFQPGFHCAQLFVSNERIG